MEKKKEIALVYMVAGISSRFGGRIKQFAKVGPNQETLIEHSLKQALPAGFAKIVFIVGEKTAEPFKGLFKDNFQGIPVYYAFQDYDKNKRDKPWGTVDALCSAKEILDCPFVLCNGDDIYGAKSFKTLVNHLQTTDEPAAIGYKLIEVLPKKGKVNRAIFEVDKENYVKNLNEVFDIEKINLDKCNINPDDLCSMNIFALSQKIVSFLNSQLEDFKEKYKDDRETECLLPVELSKLINKKIKMKIYPASDKWFGITNPEDEEIVREMIRRDSQDNMDSKSI